MISDIEQWVDEALASLSLAGRKVEAEVGGRIFAEAESRFTEGNPRSWCLGLKCVRQSFPSESTKLSSLVPNPDSPGWFIPDTEEYDPVVYRLSASETEAVVLDCPYFEYNFLDEELGFLIAESHHNEFIVAEPVF